VQKDPAIAVHRYRSSQYGELQVTFFRLLHASRQMVDQAQIWKVIGECGTVKINLRFLARRGRREAGCRRVSAQ
jgi:hypothetical protein